MSAPFPRDHDRAVEAFLEAGPDQLSDRVYHAILDDLRRTPQRGRPAAPWRFPPVSRSTIVGATLAVAVTLAGIAMFATQPGSGPGPSAAPPGGATPTAAPSVPAAQPAIGSLVIGSEYRATAFARPFTFTVPNPAGGFAARFDADYRFGVCDTKAVAGPSAQTPRSCGVFRITVPSGAATFHYASTLPADLCRPQDGDRSQPTTTDAVGAWLAASTGVTVSAPTQLQVDGRTALAWDVTLSAACWSGDGSPPGDHLVWFNAGEHHRVYAVPTNGAVVIVLTWGDPPLGALNDWVNRLLATVSFE